MKQIKAVRGENRSQWCTVGRCANCKSDRKFIVPESKFCLTCDLLQGTDEKEFWKRAREKP